MTITNEQFEEFKRLRAEAALLFGEQTLPNNPNVTFGSLLSPAELEQAAVIVSPEVRTLAEQLYSPEDIQRIETAVNWDSRVAPYNRAPIDFDVDERFPDYAQEMALFEEGDIGAGSRYGAGPYNFVGYDDPRVIAPRPPIGLDKARKIAARGFEPDNELKFDNFKEGAAFRSKVGLNPRSMTVKDWEFLGKQHGLKGKYIYVDPSDPSLGVAFKAEGEDEYRLVNTPYLTAEDTYKFLINELPAIAGDITLLVYGGKKFGAGTGLYGNLPTRAAKVLGLSGLSAAGAAGGDFVRLAAGVAMGAHDRDFNDVFKESGLIGALAFAGTAVISTATSIIPLLWRNITGKNVPAEFFEQIDDLMKQARATERGEPIGPGILYGDEVSVKAINDAIEELTNRFKVDIGNYNPTLASATGRMEAADLEAIFLKHADDRGLQKLYQEIKLGNQEVIDRFVDVLGRKVGPKVGADVTAAEAGVGIRALIEKDIAKMTDESYAMINNVRNNLLEAEDIALPGQTLLKEVPDEKISTPLFQRTQKRLKEISDEFLGGYRTAFENSLKNSRYADLTTGAGFTRRPTQAWMKVRKGESASLFRALEADEAADMLFGAVNKNTLNRLRGMNPKTGKFADGKEIALTLEELNATREALNSFASQTDNAVARRYARDLERGLEKQMFKLLQEGATIESGGLTGAALKRYMKETGYGEEIALAWTAQKNAIESANSQAMRSIIQQRPEKVADYILGTSVPYSKVNNPIKDLMTVLEKEGSDVILDMQRGMAEYVRRTIFDAPGQTPFQISKAYREFMKEHQGTLEAIFGREGFRQSFKYSPNNFQREVIDKLAERELTIKQIQARFGLADISKGNNITNIVESILETGQTRKLGGELLEDISYLTSLVKDDPVLKTQIAQVTKNYLTNRILKPRQGTGGLFQLDGVNLEKLLYEGFGPADVVGQQLTFDNFIIPLLGDDAGAKQYVKNLKILNEMVQKEIGPPVTAGVRGELGMGEYGVGSPIEGARMAQRLLIPPLTQIGRRITAISNRINDNTRRYIGEMLLDDKLFTATMKWAEGRTTIGQFQKFLVSYGTVATQDLANEIEFYDVDEKVQKTPEKKTRQKASDIIEQGAAVIGATP